MFLVFEALFPDGTPVVQIVRDTQVRQIDVREHEDGSPCWFIVYEDTETLTLESCSVPRIYCYTKLSDALICATDLLARSSRGEKPAPSVSPAN